MRCGPRPWRRRGPRSRAFYGAVKPIYLIWISRGHGHRLRCPGLRACEAAVWVLPGSTVPGLHGAIAPPPLPAKSKIHSGLDGDPVKFRNRGELAA